MANNAVIVFLDPTNMGLNVSKNVLRVSYPKIWSTIADIILSFEFMQIRPVFSNIYVNWVWADVWKLQIMRYYFLWPLKRGYKN